MQIGFYKLRKFISLLLFSLTLSIVCNNAQSQSLTEKLGGITTDFVFYSDSTELTIIDQAIIKRGVYNFKVKQNAQYSYGHGYGYGLQTFHLEFTATSDIKTINEYKDKPTKAICQIYMYDENDNLLINFAVQYYTSKVAKQTSETKSYSINLGQIPIIILNRTSKIDITLIMM